MPTNALFSAWGGVFILAAIMMLMVYILARQINNAGIVDVFWSFGFSLIGIYCVTIPYTMTPRKVIVLLLFILASIRLTAHLLERFLKEHPHQDPRYTEFKAQWGKHPELMTFLAFQLQGALMAVVSLPILMVCFDNRSFDLIMDSFFILVFLAGFWIEMAADRQLDRFKSDSANRGKTCQIGLWQYSRHPNYFGEWLMWLSYALFALPTVGAYWSLISPALMLYFLLNVTGVAATEAQALKTRSDYAAYQKRTSVFVPWFKKSPR